MHYVEVRRAYDFKNPGSQDQDPIFKNNSLPKHDVGYPGGIFNPLSFGQSDMQACPNSIWQIIPFLNPYPGFLLPAVRQASEDFPHHFCPFVCLF